MPLFLIFRLHNPQGNRNLANHNKGETTNLRKRRHTIRSILLVLDYAIECVGGAFMILVIFVGDSIFYQRVLFCVGTFVYGIPIPLAYLLNESRVRDTIVNHGWLQGFCSVFYSSSHIRENKREAIQNTKRKESMAKDDGNDGFNGVLTNQLRSPNQEEANLV